jgi:hypothetical protein
MEESVKPNLEELAKQFKFNGEYLSASPYGNGHINDTYAVVFQENNGNTHRYILQRINHHIFKDPEGLMRNVEAVTSHLSQKILESGGDPKRETLTLIPCVDGGYFYKTANGDYWRAYIFIENARTYEIVENMNHVYHAAQAFGNFQSLMSDFPPQQLSETIPDFHNTPKRYENFIYALEEDRVNLAASSKPEIKFVTQRHEDTARLLSLFEQGKLHERITHNDTKFNNVMIDDKTGSGVCVIDLDTVMPGLSLYDFGDSIRSMANPAAEDEQDLSKVQFDMQVFDRYTEGYLDTAKYFLNSTEIKNLPFSAIIMTLECGMRFLTDHLEGDVYYKTHRKNHNLDRCRTQFKLVQDMEEQYGEMMRIVEKYNGEY